MSATFFETLGKPGRRPRQVALTPDLVARCLRVEPDPGPNPDWTPINDTDRETLALSLLAGRAAKDIWIFAYGSLIWNPEFEIETAQRATAIGWHREFCIEQTRWRGAPTLPGLMLALQSGGRCAGIALRPRPEDAQSVVRKLIRREITDRESLDMVRWITLANANEKLDAIVFWAGPKGHGVTRRLPLAAVASRLALACGHIGSSAEYLYNTISHLEALGIRDRNLWAIQQFAALEIESWGSR